MWEEEVRRDIFTDRGKLQVLNRISVFFKVTLHVFANQNAPKGKVKEVRAGITNE